MRSGPQNSLVLGSSNCHPPQNIKHHPVLYALLRKGRRHAARPRAGKQAVNNAPGHVLGVVVAAFWGVKYRLIGVADGSRREGSSSGGGGLGLLNKTVAAMEK
jgi:hypothetical protein